MSRHLVAILAVSAASSVAAIAAEPTDTADRRALNQTSIAIRDAFARGDVAGIMAYHHPEVEKSFGPDSRVVGKAAVAVGAADTLKAFALTFVENDVESLAIRGDTAVEVTRFAIRGVPRGDGKPFTFKGRTQVVYVRYDPSPTKWAVFRELIQPIT
jgi:ketosteroid isomerase-like protein